MLLPPSWGRADEPDVVEKPLQVAAGYRVEQVAPPPLVTYPMFACFDDQGRLYVAESSGLDLYRELTELTRRCRIRVLEDLNGDGRFDRATTFADELVYPMGLAWHDGRLYVADPPLVVALSDTTGDGKADRREKILGDFGHRDNGSLHGLVFGPDGRLYMTMGTPDGFDLKVEGQSVATGTSGALIRCLPDGSDPEVLCRGFENLIEVVFTPSGRILGSNNWYQKPVGGIRDSLLHLVPGGIYPRHSPAGSPRFLETGEPLPAIDLFPAVAISGLDRLRVTQGDADHTLVSAQFNTRQVVAHRLERSGSTYISGQRTLVSSESPYFRPADVLEDADGSLLVIDTGLWYVQHCAINSTRRVAGGIYRLIPEGISVPGDPRGLEIDFASLEVEPLIQLLSDSRPVVVDRARETLVKRGPPVAESLAKALQGEPQGEAAVELVWALSRIGGDTVPRQLQLALASEDADVKASAARALGIARDDSSVTALGRLLESSQPPRIRLAAAEALARCKTSPPLADLWRALEADDVDRMLEHALLLVIYQAAETEDLRRALRHPSARVQQGALVLLSQRPGDSLQAADVIPRIASSDERLRDTCLRLLHRHPEWGAAAIDLLRRWLQGDDAPAEDALGALILALETQPEIQDLVGQALAGELAEVDIERRRQLLVVVREATLKEIPARWIEATTAILQNGPASLQSEAVRTAVTLRLDSVRPQLTQIADDADVPLATRLDALGGIIGQGSTLDESQVGLLLEALRSEAPLSRLAAVEILRSTQPDGHVLTQVLAVVGDDMLLWPALLPIFERPGDEAVGMQLLERLESLVREGRWGLDQDQAAEVLKHYPASVSDRAKGLFQAIADRQQNLRGRLAEFQENLSGGDPDRGRAIFFGAEVACAACHRVGDQGGNVGPDLSRIGAIRSSAELLESVVLPSETFVQGYQTFQVLTTDGRMVTGVIARQRSNQEQNWQPSDPLLVIRDAAGKEHRLLPDEVEELGRSTVSLMPEGLLQKLTAQQVKDLFAFLDSLR